MALHFVARRLAVFVGSFFLLAASAHAQASFSIGPRLGLNASTYHFSAATPADRQRYRAGFEAGLLASVGFGHFAVQPALLYTQKGNTQYTTVDVRTGTNIPAGTGELKNSYRLNYLTLPVNVAYVQHPDGQGFQVFAGPYVALLLSGRYENEVAVSGKSTTDSGKITPVANDAPGPDAYARRLDAGLQAGLGYRYQHLLLQFDYSLGLRDIGARYYYNGVAISNPAYYNRAFQASLAYLLGSGE
jgi:hypothetical protein